VNHRRFGVTVELTRQREFASRFGIQRLIELLFDSAKHSSDRRRVMPCGKTMVRLVHKRDSGAFDSVLAATHARSGSLMEICSSTMYRMQTSCAATPYID
jgi:hypothetical protein